MKIIGMALVGLMICASPALAGLEPSSVKTSIHGRDIHVTFTIERKSKEKCLVKSVELIDPDGHSWPAQRLTSGKETAKTGPSASIRLPSIVLDSSNRDEEEDGRAMILGGMEALQGLLGPAKRTATMHASLAIPDLNWYRRTPGQWKVNIVTVCHGNVTKKTVVPALPIKTSTKKEACQLGTEMGKRQERQHGKPSKDVIRLKTMESWPPQVWENWIKNVPDEGPTRGLASWYKAHVTTGELKKRFRDEVKRCWHHALRCTIHATVISVRGNVKYQPGAKGRWLKVRKGMVFCDGTRIKTGYRSNVVLAIDGKQIYIHPLTECTVTGFAYPPRIHIIDKPNRGLTVPVRKERHRTDKNVSTPNNVTGVTD